jgi:hypothetical protein
VFRGRAGQELDCVFSTCEGLGLRSSSIARRRRQQHYDLQLRPG